MRLLKRAAFAVTALVATVSTSQAETFNWKLQTFWGGGSQPQQVVEAFADRVKAATGGSMNITVLPNKAIVAHNQSLQAVGSGILEMHKNTPCYSAGIDAAFGMLCEMNAAYENPYQFMAWYYKAGGIEIAREIYAKHGLYFVGPVPWGTESIPSKDPIRSLADFEGVKIRMPEGPSSDLFRSIGAAPVTVPGSEVYTSLEKGVISATDWGTISMNEKMGLHKVAKYAIYPGIHSVPVGDVSVNLDKWNALPDDIKAAIELGVQSLGMDMVQTFTAADAEVVGQAAEMGITLIKWAPEERQKLRAAAME
ncbi:MAG: TRAP transporter substrate-binding protein DctP, partial [Pseudomonadota bacterium]